MRKISKSLLSMALVIAMVLSIMPMSFAEGESGLTIKYDIAGACTPDGAGDTASVDTGKNPVHYCTMKKTNEFFEYVSDSVGFADNSGNLKLYNEYGLIHVKYNNWLILKLNVPVAGEYKIYVNNNAHDKGLVGNFYISKELPATNSAIFSDGTFVGELQTNKGIAGVTSGIGGSWAMTLDVANPVKTTDGKDATYTFNTAGTYYMAIRAVVNNNITTSQDRFQFGNIWLVSGDGKGNALVGDMTVSPESVKVGESATASATAYKSDDASLATLTYASTNTDVATVDATTGVITAKKAGKATITATAEGSVNSLARELTVTSADASNVTVTYDIIKNSANSTPHAELYTYDTTNGFFKYVWDYTGDALFNWNRKFINNTLQLAYNRYEVFEINVPVAGEYDVKVKYGSDANGGNMDVYLFKSNGEEKITHVELNAQTVFGTVNCHDENDTATTISPALQAEPKNIGTFKFEKGKYFFAVRVNDNTSSKYGFLSGLILDGGDGEALIGKISGVSDELEVGESATATASVYLSKSGTAAANLTFESSDTSVLEVSANGAVTAKAAGNAEIIVKSADAIGEIRKSVKVNAPAPTEPGEIVLDTIVNFTFVASDATAGTVSAKGYPAVGEIAMGTAVEATATANDGYEFAYWRNGAGTVLSTEATAKFKFNTNTAVYAEFVKVSDESASETSVYFYNGNGEKLATEIVEKGTTFANVKKPTATLTGFAFDKWSISDSAIINTITRAVALFKDTNKTYTIKADDAIITSTATYGSEVTVTSTVSDFKAWKLGDKAVSYDKSYTFYVWGDIALTSTNKGEIAPVATLTTVEGKPMLIYDVPSDCEIIEAGILFGNGASIASYESKAFAKTNTGEFTAQPNGEEANKVARGYLIFRKDGEIRVVYAD